MEYEDCLNTVSSEIANEIEAICSHAGTCDADWEVLKSAGEISAELRSIIREYITAADDFDINKWIVKARRVTEDFDQNIVE